jgi:hypothetical protein
VRTGAVIRLLFFWPRLYRLRLHAGIATVF